MGSRIHIERGKEGGIGEAAGCRCLGKEDVEQVVLIGSAHTLRESRIV